jgi:parallel beta-helix repeat protein
MSFTPSIAVDTLKESYMPTYNGKTLYVGGTGEGNYTRIQKAVYGASDGDTVFVYNDSSPYNENIWIYKSIKLIGEDRNTTVIDGGRIESTLLLYGGDITVSGFTIRGGVKNALSAGIKIFSENNVISNNIIRNNANGIISYQELQDDNNLVYDNLIIKNEADGIFLYDAHEWNISNNNISSNDESGIAIRGSSYSIISYNVIFSDKSDSISIAGGQYCTISNNVIHSDNKRGLLLNGGKENSVKGNKISNCKSHGIYISISSNYNLIENNVFENDGLYIWKSKTNYIVDNIVNGKPLIYLENITNREITEDAGQIILNRCTNITIKNQRINNTDYSIFLLESTECIITNSILDSNDCGIFVIDSGYVNIGHNSFQSNIYGAFLKDVANCLIRNNNFEDNNVGLIIDCDDDYTLYNRVEYNNFIKNKEQADFVVKYNWFYRPIRWRHNYWDDNIILRFLYIIHGNYYLGRDTYSGLRYLRNHIHIEWLPALRPYDIEVVI